LAVLLKKTKNKMTLQNESGKFLLSFYGNILALGFKGEKDFIRRCHNWAHNYSITSGGLHWFYEQGGALAYVLVKSRDDILRGLAQQFRADIIISREILPLKEELNYEFDPENEESALKYNEKKIEKLAWERAENFFKERVELENFLSRIPTSIAPAYEVSRGGFRAFGQRENNPNPRAFSQSENNT
jgi:hypothetical protein